MTVDSDFATAFARDWVQAWNDRDLEAILRHYSDDIVFHSPRIRVVTGRAADSVTGKAELRAYWEKALGLARDLYFEVDQVYVGSNAITIIYTNQRQQSVAETFVFGPSRRVTTSVATYAG